VDLSYKVFNEFTEYEFKARIFPTVFMLLPLVITILTWYPQLINFETSILILFILMVTISVLAKFVREKGRKIQDKLFDKGKNFPTTTYLKHSDTNLNKYTKARYHKYLNINIENLNIPSVEQELENPEFYNEQYDSAVDWLLEKTRNTNKYQLIYQNNINYGLSRNMLGIKPLGISIAVLSIIIDFIGIYERYHFSLLELLLGIKISLLLSLIFLLY